MRRVLVVDDDPVSIQVIARALGSEPIRVEATCGDDGVLRQLRDPDTLAVLWSDDKADSMTLARSMSDMPDGCFAKVWVMSSSFTVERLIQLYRSGICDFLQVPITHAAIEQTVVKYVALRTRQSHYLVRRIDRYLRENCSRSDLSMAMVAGEFAVSSGYVGRLYREEFGQPFGNRLVDLRVARAKCLLAQTNDPINLISDACGFRSPSRLSEAFRRFTGLAPRAYRYLSRECDHPRSPANSQDHGELGIA